jgi:DNA (cytosine-5)-methyltransferase 1
MTAVGVLDLFAGAGGLSIGLGAAGFTIVAGADIDPDACDTYAKAHPAAEVLRLDVAQVSFRPWRDAVDCVAGGPPCQPWSTGGKRLGTDDPRDGWPGFLKALEEIAPRAFIAENVAGLVSGIRRPYFEALMKRLEDLGFTVASKVVNAADYGVPQNRLRLIMVGLRKGAFLFPAPARGLSRPSRPPAGAVINAEPIGIANPSIVTYARHPDLRPNAYDGHIFNGGGRPIDLTKPAPTLLASMGGNKTPWVDTLGIVPEYHAHLRSGGEPRTGRVPGARRITVEEAALLQTFPPGMRFAGRRSSCYRQIGNAVPPLLARAIGDEILRQLG